ncbi:MAG TPA: hypothetical protein VFW49_15100 [Fluviicoccus sp.]|nr:hypothetical protein [Fluviicoccus sp.]
MRDIELAKHFPENISDAKRNRMARLGALYILFAMFGVPLFVVLLARL